jgi:hypothetical protein
MLYIVTGTEAYMNKAYINHSRFSFCVVFFRGRVCYKLFPWPYAPGPFMENVDGIHILFESYSIMCPIPYDIVLHYHTVYYFLVFFVFVPYTYTKCGGDICYVGILDYEGRGSVGNGVE